MTIGIDVMESSDSRRRLRCIVVLSSFQVPGLNSGSQGRSQPLSNMLGRSHSSASNQRKAGGPA